MVYRLQQLDIEAIVSIVLNSSHCQKKEREFMHCRFNYSILFQSCAEVVCVFLCSVTSAVWSPSREYGGTVRIVRRTTRSISAPTGEILHLCHEIKNDQIQNW